MKHLKTFEAWEMLVPKEEHFNGLTKEFIDDMFIDLHDDGFKVFTRLDKRAITSVDKEKGQMIIGSIPFIWVKCDKSITIEELEEYKKSEEFSEIIDIANDRLEEFDWYISEVQKVYGTPSGDSTMKIFMHRVEDKKHVV